jgi:hypothetical protein
MTTIGSTNSYSISSLLALRVANNGSDTGGSSAYSAPKQSQTSSATITGSDTSFGAKLSSALWTMESQGVEIDQDGGDTYLGEKPSSTAEDEFMKLAHQTFAERVREQYLKSHDLTEDDLKAMSPEDWAAVEDDIRKTIMEAMGVNGDKQDALKKMGADAQPDSGSFLSASQQSGTGSNSLRNGGNEDDALLDI